MIQADFKAEFKPKNAEACSSLYEIWALVETASGVRGWVLSEAVDATLQRTSEISAEWNPALSTRTLAGLSIHE